MLFLECAEELQQKVCEPGCPLKLNKREILLFVELMHKVKPLLKTDFYCDKMSTHLLMNVHLDTEKVPEADYINAKIDLGLSEGQKKTIKSEKFNMEDYIA